MADDDRRAAGVAPRHAAYDASVQRHGPIVYTAGGPLARSAVTYSSAAFPAPPAVTDLEIGEWVALGMGAKHDPARLAAAEAKRARRALRRNN